MCLFRAGDFSVQPPGKVSAEPGTSPGLEGGSRTAQARGGLSLSASESESASPDLGGRARGEPRSPASLHPLHVPTLAHTPGPAQPIARPGQLSFIPGDRLAPSPQRPRGQLHQRRGQLRPGFGAEPGGQVRPLRCRGCVRPVPPTWGRSAVILASPTTRTVEAARTVQKWGGVMKNWMGTPHHRDRA